MMTTTTTVGLITTSMKATIIRIAAIPLEEDHLTQLIRWLPHTQPLITNAIIDTVANSGTSRFCQNL